MQITEPITMLTDYALAATSFLYAVLMGRLVGPRNRLSAWFWCAAFIASGMAAASGGTIHGFEPHLAASALRALSHLSVYSIGACCAFVAAGVHSAYIRRKDGAIKWLVGGIGVTLLGVVVQQSGFRRGGNFNHNDVYHLIQIVGLYFLFRCAQIVRDRPGMEPVFSKRGT